MLAGHLQLAAFLLKSLLRFREYSSQLQKKKGRGGGEGKFLLSSDILL